jgi:hypothetical protein
MRAFSVCFPFRNGNQVFRDTLASNTSGERAGALAPLRNEGEDRMQLGRWLIPAVGALALGYAAPPAQAAPVGGVEGLKASSANADVQQVHRRYRRYHHYYYDDHRYYRRHRPGVHFYIAPRRHYHRHRHWY